MQKISGIILGYLVNDHDAFEQDIYRYGIEVFLLNTINVLSILFLGYISNTIIDAIIFLVTFIIFRQLTGGFHFKSYSKCLVSFALIYVLFLFLSIIVLWDLNVCLIIIIFDLLFIMMISPVENINKPLCESVVRKLMIKKIYVSLLFMIIYLIFYRNMHAMIYALTLDVILILIEKIKRRS